MFQKEDKLNKSSQYVTLINIILKDISISLFETKINSALYLMMRYLIKTT